MLDNYKLLDNILLTATLLMVQMLRSINNLIEFKQKCCFIDTLDCVNVDVKPDIIQLLGNVLLSTTMLCVK